MAVSSTTGSSSTSTTSIDVAGIVQQLMTVENRPLDAIKAKITQQNTVISDLGTIKSKVSTLQEVLQAFQDPTTFNATSVGTTDSSVVQATSSNGAKVSSHSIVIDSIATSSQFALTGYNSSAALATVDASSGFSLTINGVTYNTLGTPAGTAALGASPTITDLKNWINGLGANVSANVVQTTSSTNWALQIGGTQAGLSNAISFTGLTGTTGATPSITSTPVSIAGDASFTLDGTAFVRSSNSINDVLSGVTLNLIKKSPTDSTQVINITKGANTSSQAINTLITAYNDLMSSYKTMTANSSNSTTPGTFANSPTTLSFINQIKASFAKGLSYTSSGTLKTMSLNELGIDLQLDGTAKFNAVNFTNASANGLQDVLASGVTMGRIDGTHNLNTFLTSQVSTGGALDSQIQSQNESVRNLTKRQDDLQTRLNAVQNNLISQYSALNALLFQLNNTSTALTSALDALTNSQSKN